MSESVSVIIPVYNEIENLDALLERVVSTCEKLPNPWEVILVDDGSRDGSSDRLEAAAGLYGGHLRAIILNRNYGQHAAIICGFSHARGDIVITLDADLQNPPEEIPNLVKTIEDGNDVVGTIRRNRQDSFFRRKASACINWMVQKSTGVAMHDYGCMLRAYRRPVVNAILQCRERSTFIPVLANSFAKRAAEIEVGHAERAAGESKYSVWKLVNLQFDLLTSMTTTPLETALLGGRRHRDGRGRLRRAPPCRSDLLRYRVGRERRLHPLCDPVHLRRRPVHRNGSARRIPRAGVSGRQGSPPLLHRSHRR